MYCFCCCCCFHGCKTFKCQMSCCILLLKKETFITPHQSPYCTGAKTRVQFNALRRKSLRKGEKSVHDNVRGVFEGLCLNFELGEKKHSSRYQEASFQKLMDQLKCPSQWEIPLKPGTELQITEAPLSEYERVHFSIHAQC